MVKHYCDKCGIELANAERCRISVSIAQGYVKIPDLMDTLRQEYGVDLRE